MKTLLILSIVLAMTSGYQPISLGVVYNLGNECSIQGCQQSTWRYNNTNYSFTCPTSGQFGIFKKLEGGYYEFNFTTVKYPSFSYTPISLYKILGTSEIIYGKGVEFYADLDDRHVFVILNCSFYISKNITSLCNSNDYVGGKVMKNSLQEGCFFSINKSTQAFLQKEMPLGI